MVKILIIDDEAPIRKMLTKLLMGEGYDVVSAENGAAAMKLFQKGIPDLIISDVIMPEKDGLEVLQAIQKNFPDIKVIAISGGGTGEAGIYLKFAEKMGASYTFSKPLDNSRLLSAVQDLTARD